MNPPRPPFPPQTPNPLNFGTNTNVPFIFQSPVPNSQHPPPWAPPSPTKTFLQPEPHDVDMGEPSPVRPEDTSKSSEEDPSRAVSLGGMRRVFRSRQKRAKSRIRTTVEDDHSEEETESETENRVVRSKSAGPQTLSNHYTLNMPSTPAPKSDLPYMLWG